MACETVRRLKGAGTPSSTKACGVAEFMRRSSEESSLARRYRDMAEMSPSPSRRRRYADMADEHQAAATGYAKTVLIYRLADGGDDS